MATVIRDLTQVRVALVERLPFDCGGGVAMMTDDGLMWVLIEESSASEPLDDFDLAEWVNVGYAALESGEPLSCADQARRYGVDIKTAQAAWWAFAWEWWEHEHMARVL